IPESSPIRFSDLRPVAGTIPDKWDGTRQIKASLSENSLQSSGNPTDYRLPENSCKKIAFCQHVSPDCFTTTGEPIHKPGTRSALGSHGWRPPTPIAQQTVARGQRPRPQPTPRSKVRPGFFRTLPSGFM